MLARMRLVSFLCALSLFSFSSILSAQSADTLVVPKKVTFSKSCRVNNKVKKECRLEEKTAKFIADFSKGNYSKVVHEKPSSGKYHILSAEIINVHGAGGGAWSGAKSMKVKGTLKDASGKVLGTFEAGRYSGGGAFGGYKGTCSIFGRCTKTIGKDIAEWMISPDMDAILGDH